MLSAFPSVLRSGAGGKKYQPNDKIEVYSNTLGSWIKDGQVVRIADKSFEADGLMIPVGSVEVSYGEGMYVKWVLEEDVSTTLRRPRSNLMPVLLGQNGPRRTGKDASSRISASDRRLSGRWTSSDPMLGWSTATVGKADTIGPRPTMEDEFVHVDHFGNSATSSFYAVYDGHGGRTAVDFVKHDLHARLQRELEVNPRNVNEAFCRAFAATDKALANCGCLTCGCTACCCLIKEEASGPVVYTAHVGDTRAVLSRSGKAKRLTAMSDHKPADPAEAQRIARAGASVVNRRVNGMLAVARALGDHYLKEPCRSGNAVSNQPDVSMERLGKLDEFLIIACDGLWDVMSDQDAVDLVKQSLAAAAKAGMLRGEAAEAAARTCVMEALQRGTTDNVTCSVIVPTIADAPQPERKSY
mmetsp:Transcript_34333/g.80338  ORF Transcript_34333/g.80338 Transcript_34333/m.80338 type:complete len:413 (-) Transcript_34333:317-1555(-)|eukprot:CAMPEP_0178440292 /NCGR_PEP_ID=MMETSP0689_2-20121128/36685_1 /TAXON_ID=160604 /ORGANISM="Amphidinium massartii, Strain CS-259" /LENGTH=412 /DNA_ID=CAMNT_0020063025 /DNA_START=110 /DNA_END=1348 /DNA_ORIENTATION=-